MFCVSPEGRRSTWGSQSTTLISCSSRSNKFPWRQSNKFKQIQIFFRILTNLNQLKSPVGLHFVQFVEIMELCKTRDAIFSFISTQLFWKIINYMLVGLSSHCHSDVTEYVWEVWSSSEKSRRWFLCLLLASRFYIQHFSLFPPFFARLFAK